MIPFIIGLAVGEVLTILLIYMGYCWHEYRKGDGS